MTVEKKEKLGMIILIAAIIVVLIVVFIIGFFALEVKRYIDTHTWATIRVSGEINSDTAGAFTDEQECLKGDTISFGGIILNITDITHDGTVTFEVQQGDLLNADGEFVSEETLVLGNKADFKWNDGHVSLVVSSNRYQ